MTVSCVASVYRAIRNTMMGNKCSTCDNVCFCCLMLSVFFTSTILVGQIGIFNESVTVDESVGSIRILVGFISPAQVSADIAVNISFSTEDNSAMGKSQVHQPVSKEFILLFLSLILSRPLSFLVPFPPFVLLPHFNPPSRTPSSSFQRAQTTLTLQ